MRRKGKAINGVLLLDKPSGISSHTALQNARHVLEAAKAGHTGTLDPLASGLLPLCLGEATKFSALLLDAHKTYSAHVMLGVCTTTGDAEGEIISTEPTAHLSPPQIERALAGIVGTLEQVPPMYSALKHQGRPLYQYAREGQTVERASRPVTIYALEVLRIESPLMQIRIEVSKGTYIRSLAEEIGRRLGCGAHLTALRRERVGPFGLSQAVTLEQLTFMDSIERLAHVLPTDVLLAGLPRVDLDERSGMAMRQGQVVRVDGAQAGLVRMYDHAGAFIGVGRTQDDACVAPQRLLQTA